MITYIIFQDKDNIINNSSKMRIRELTYWLEIANINEINIRFIDNTTNKEKSILYKRLNKLAKKLGYTIKPIKDFNDLGSIREYNLRRLL